MPSYIDTPRKGARWHRLPLRLEGHDLTLWSAAGLFSAHRLDPGTRLLIEAAPAAPGHRVLDLGCGIGVVGISLLLRGGIDVTFSDVNPLAVQAARRNLALMKMDAPVIQSDLYAKITGAFDVILTNPPIVAGRPKLYALIGGAPAHLLPGGNLALVARHNKGGRMLAGRMKDGFGNVVELAKGGGFRVYASQKAKD